MSAPECVPLAKLRGTGAVDHPAYWNLEPQEMVKKFQKSSAKKLMMCVFCNQAGYETISKNGSLAAQLQQGTEEWNAILHRSITRPPAPSAPPWASFPAFTDAPPPAIREKHPGRVVRGAVQDATTARTMEPARFEPSASMYTDGSYTPPSGEGESATAARAAGAVFSAPAGVPNSAFVIDQSMCAIINSHRAELLALVEAIRMAATSGI